MTTVPLVQPCRQCYGKVSQPGVYWDKDTKRNMVDIDSGEGVHGYLRIPLEKDEIFKAPLQEAYQNQSEVTIVYTVHNNEIITVKRGRGSVSD